MRTIILAAILVSLLGPVSAPVARVGVLVYYAPGLMERVYQKRIAQHLAPAGWQGILTTSPYCHDIGDVVKLSIQNPHTKAWGNYEKALVVDCSQPVDRARHIAMGLREVGYPTAKRYGFVDTGKAKAKVITK